LQKDVLDFSPDIVLLAMFPGNDIEGNWRKPAEVGAWRMPAPVHRIVDGALVIDMSFDRSPLRKLLYKAVHYSRVIELVNEARHRIKALTLRSSDPEGVEAGLSSQVYVPPRSPEWRQAWLVTEALLAKMNDLARSRGASFIVVTIPEAIQVRPQRLLREQSQSGLGVDDLLFPDRKIAEIGLRSGFRTYPLTRDLQDIAEQRQIYMHGFENTRPGSGHLNERGHEILADLLATKLCGSADDDALQALAARP
jgi:hypothetical protein